MSIVEKFYTEGQYHQNNPDWDRADVQWKFAKLSASIDQFLTADSPQKICEIGCGSGDFLRLLAKKYPQHQFFGWDIAPQAQNFWTDLPANLTLRLGDLSAIPTGFDLVIALDVIEHVADPLEFLHQLSQKGRHFVFHIPLDLSAVSAIFDQKLLFVRKSVGHIHYFTKNIAVQMLTEAGFKSIQCQWTDAWKDSPQASRNPLARAVRGLIYWLFGDLGANIIGGQTVVVKCRQ